MSGNRGCADVCWVFTFKGRSAGKGTQGIYRVELQAGEEKLVTIACPLEKLAYYDPYTRQMTVEKMEYELYIGTSEADCDLIKGNVQI